jgi:hypothetical protein
MAKPRPAQDYGRDFLHCRTFGHTWNMAKAEAQGPTLFQFILTCSHCGTRRIDLINSRTGARALHGGRSYEYPEGYQAHRGEAIDRTDYRREFIRRLRDEPT